MSEDLSESAIVSALAEQTARRITREVITALQQMTDTLSGDDSELKTTWDEICAQVQFQESVSWETYDETVRGIVAGHLAALPKYEQGAMWLQTDAGIDWNHKERNDREAHPVNDEDIVEWLTREHVYAAAADWSNVRIRAYLDREG